MKTKFEKKIEKFLISPGENLNAFEKAIEAEFDRRVKSKEDYIALPMSRQTSNPWAFGPSVAFWWCVGMPGIVDDFSGTLYNKPVKKTREIYGGKDVENNPFIFRNEFDALVFAEMLNSAACNVLRRLHTEENKK